MFQSIKSTQFFVGFSLLFCFWGSFFQQSIWSNALFVYVGLILILGLSLCCLLNNSQCLRSVNIYAAIWIPYLLGTMISVIISADIERFTYWFLCFVLIVTARTIELTKSIPYRLLWISGIVCLVGVWVQILLPDIYNEHIVGIFMNAQTIKNWARWSYGYAGFTYQLGMTAIILVYFEAFILYFWKCDKKYFRAAVLILTIISIFLTGKRMLSVLAVIAPIEVYVASDGSIGKKKRNTLLAIAIGLIVLVAIYINIDAFADNKVFGRIARGIIDLQQGEDITTSRSDLWGVAVETWKKSPIFGVGVGKIKAAAGIRTDAHNAFVQVLCERGVVGLLLFVFPLIISYANTVSLFKRNGNKTENVSLKFSFFIQTIFILYSLTGNTTTDRHCFIMYFLAVGIMIVNTRKDYCEEPLINGKNRNFDVSQSN